LSRDFAFDARDPAWPEIEAAYSGGAGKSLTKLFLLYRMKADAGPVRGYSRAHFMRRRLAWIAAGKPDLPPPREPLGSLSRPSPRAPLAPVQITGGLAYIDHPGVALQIRSGALALRFKDGGERLFRPGEKHPLQTIIVAASASITSDAIAWLARERIALLLSTHSGEFLSMFAMDPVCDASVRGLDNRLKQFSAVLDKRKSAAIAKAIVARKIATSGLRDSDVKAVLAKLASAKTTEGARLAEAQAASYFYEQFRGLELRFKGGAPDHWRAF